jgi:hypothetical protein
MNDVNECLSDISFSRIPFTNKSTHSLIRAFSLLLGPLNRGWIFEEIRVRGLRSEFINIIRECYEVSCCRVLHEGQLSDPIKTSSGVRQGCLLSPMLFVSVLEEKLRRVLDGKQSGITWRLKESLEEMKYAEDVCLIS